jgi:hypothetical protein
MSPMKTLDDAWKWYCATKVNLTRMQCLGENHWDDPSMESASIWKDDRLKQLPAKIIVEESTISLEPIDDLAIVVMFSVFEANLREDLLEAITSEAEEIDHPILKEAADDACRGIAEGSFYRCVLEPLKRQRHVPADLVTQVDQIRQYRNWVAHGQRGSATNLVTPQQAYVRLTQFLNHLDQKPVEPI